MADASLLLFSFSLGAAAFFSPCGFPMLPAYLAYYLPRGAPDAGPGGALLRGLLGGLLAASGAFVLLLLIGGLAASVGAPFKERVVVLELVGGLLVIALGIATLAGRGPSVRLAVRASQKRHAWALAGFGALYAAVAASCVAPLLLAVLVLAIQAPTPLEGFLYVAAYGAGLGVLLVAATTLVATAQHALLDRLKAALPRVEKASGVLLVLVGLYLVYFWASIEYGLPPPPTWTPPLP